MDNDRLHGLRWFGGDCCLYPAFCFFAAAVEHGDTVATKKFLCKSAHFLGPTRFEVVMEVLLKDTKGVSPETIISIRAGSARRQVPVTLARDKPFQFPCPLSECGAIQVDFMSVTASARAILQPQGEQCEQDVRLKVVKNSSSEEAVPAEAEARKGCLALL
eukprot:s38_g5.t1